MGKNYIVKPGLINKLFFLVFITLFPALIFPLKAYCEEQPHSVITDGYSHDQLKRGERFFKGLLPFERKHNACTSCHNIKSSDTLNWNPSAMDIALKYSVKDFASFQSEVMQPTGIKMSQVHQQFEISEDDLKLVKAYLDNMAHLGYSPTKPSINSLLWFLFLGVLITWALLELIFFRKIKYRIIPTAILLITFGWQISILVKEGIRIGRQQDYAPDQPIKFSHKVHAGDNNIDCLYCHHTAEQSKSAGIPAANLCMNCHILIREGTNSGKFEISKVVDAVDSNHPIDWIRIHNLPDHVFFSHAVHVGSGKLDCNQCHGPVEEMDIMRQENDLSMGWCVNCHRETQVNFEENGYYDTFIKMHEDLKAGKIDTITAEDVGANDCMKCHY